MKIKDIIEDIGLVRHHFSDLIIERNQEVTDCTVAWKNYIPGISKKLYAKEYEYLRKENQYSFMLINKGLIQYFYEYKNNILFKARLAYYPYPIMVKDNYEDLESYFFSEEDLTVAEYYYDLGNIANAQLGIKMKDETSNIEMNIAEKVGKSEIEVLEENFNLKYLLTNTSHIRFDFDKKVNSHNLFEIQYSSLNSIRIPSCKIISPLLFMDFIVRNEFKEYYTAKARKNNYRASYNASYKKSTVINNFTYNNFHLYNP